MNGTFFEFWMNKFYDFIQNSSSNIQLIKGSMYNQDNALLFLSTTLYLVLFVCVGANYFLCATVINKSCLLTRYIKKQLRAW
jgi:hypothetical protein